jgi:hypothetical protein
MDRLPSRPQGHMDQPTTPGAERIGDRDLQPESLTLEQQEAAAQAEAQRRARAEELADLDQGMMAEFQSSLAATKDPMTRTLTETSSVQNLSKPVASKAMLSPAKRILMSIWTTLSGGS